MNMKKLTRCCYRIYPQLKKTSRAGVIFGNPTRRRRFARRQTFRVGRTSFNFFSNFVIEYAITNKRIIIKSGLIGTDYKSIYFEQISQVVIDVGLIGKIFGTGNLKIDTGKTETYSSGGARVGGVSHQSIRTRTMYDTLKNIDNPY